MGGWRRAGCPEHARAPVSWLAMRRLSRRQLFMNHGDLATLPSRPRLLVELGERFIVETADASDVMILDEEDALKPRGPMAGNPSTGPVGVSGVRAGETIAIHVEDLQVVGHSTVRMDPRFRLDARSEHERPAEFVAIDSEFARFPGGLAVPLSPMLGCIGVVPAEPSPDPWHHGGNMDIPDVCAGNVVHVRAQRDEAWFCCGDGHAVQGVGEINGGSLEVALDCLIRIERSPYAKLRSILIEAPGEWLVVGHGDDLLEGVRIAAADMAAVVASLVGIAPDDAVTFVTHVADVSLGAMWPLWALEDPPTPVPVVLRLPHERLGARGE